MLYSISIIFLKYVNVDRFNFVLGRNRLQTKRWAEMEIAKNCEIVFYLFDVLAYVIA